MPPSGSIGIGGDRAPPKFASILGLGFGDCGKGLFTDFLCRRWNAHTVVRFNGGAQAGHNVVLPDGRHHTFSQFGAGSFLPHMRTVLAAPVVVHPTALLIENRFLSRAGVHHALGRLVIDGRCRINTPFHQAAGRLREWMRGSAAHGTCGIGFGETVRHSIARPDLTLRYDDLAQPRMAAEKLEAIRIDLGADFESLRRAPFNTRGSDPSSRGQIGTELGVLRDQEISMRWFESIAELLRSVPPADSNAIAPIFHAPGTVLFEGAQGILLDEWNGFHPHTTWSSVHGGAVDALAAEWGLTEPVHHLGVLRSYLTRHGHGPFPTHDPELDALAEPHNGQDGWQGGFRRGHPDEVLLRYALDAIGPLSGLLVSHLDAIEKSPRGLQWCRAYDIEGGDRIERLHPGEKRDLARQEAWTENLKRANPCYEAQPIRDSSVLLERLATISKLPILFGSRGNTYLDVEKNKAK